MNVQQIHVLLAEIINTNERGISFRTKTIEAFFDRKKAERKLSELTQQPADIGICLDAGESVHKLWLDTTLIDKS